MVLVLPLVKKLKAVKKAVIFASEAADFRLENRTNKSMETPPLRPGEVVLLHRPQSKQAKESHMEWIGGYRVVTTDNRIVKVENIENGVTDWVHRHQVRSVPPKPSHLVDPIPLTRGKDIDKVVNEIWIKA